MVCKNMIDVQFLAIPETKELINAQNNETMWFSIADLENENDISDEIKTKIKVLYEKYKTIRNY